MKHYENGNQNFFSKHVRGSAKSRIYPAKEQKGDFLKKTLQELKNYFCFRIDRMNPLNAWKGKLEVASFLPSKNLYRQCDVVCVVCFSNHLLPKFRNPLFFATHFSFQISGGKGHFQVYDSNEPVVAICQGCTGKEGNDPATTTAATVTTTSGHSGLLFLF